VDGVDLVDAMDEVDGGGSGCEQLADGGFEELFAEGAGALQEGFQLVA